METLGAYAILLAFCLSIYAFAASLAGKLKHKPFLIVSGERAVYGVWVLLTTAAGILVYSLLTSDFRLAYVAARSNRAMPLVYKFAAWWGGQEGSLLLWSWLLSTFAAVVVFTNRRKHRDMMPYVKMCIRDRPIAECGQEWLYLSGRRQRSTRRCRPRKREEIGGGSCVSDYQSKRYDE